MKYVFPGRRYNFYPPLEKHQAPESAMSAVWAAIFLVVLMAALIGMAAIVYQSVPLPV